MNNNLIVLAGALPAEMAGIRGLGHFRKAGTDHISYYTGGIHGKGVALVVSGVGGERAYEAARVVCAALKVRAYISVGYSAGLKPELRPGDVVVGVRTTRVNDQAACLESDRALLQIATGALVGHGTCLFGPMLASDRVLVKAEEKRKISLSYKSPQPPFDKGGQGGIYIKGEVGRPLALDMESFGAARAAAEAGVPFLAVRVISDSLDEDLPVDFNRFTKDGGMDWPRFLLHIVTHPGVIPPLIRLGRDSRLAAHNLAAAVERMIGAV